MSDRECYARVTRVDANSSTGSNAIAIIRWIHGPRGIAVRRDGAPISALCCGDCNGDGMVVVNKLVTAANRALTSCEDDVAQAEGLRILKAEISAGARGSPMLESRRLGSLAARRSSEPRRLLVLTSKAAWSAQKQLH